MSAAGPPPLPWSAALGPVFDERTEGPVVPLDLMLDRLRRRFPGMTVDVAAGDAAIREHYAKLEAMGCPPVMLGDWRRRLGTEPVVSLDAAGAAVQLQLEAIENPHLEAVWFGIDAVIPHAGPPTAGTFAAAAGEVADALGFGFGLQVNPTESAWGVNIDAERTAADPHERLRAGLPGSSTDVLTGHRVGRPASFLPDRGAANWPAACRRAAGAWCESAKFRGKPAMLATYGGADGVAGAILRDLAALGPTAAFREFVTGAAFENTAVVTCGEWTVTVRFSGVPTGQLREPGP